MEQELQRRVITIYAKTKSSMVEETGISSSVDENDIKSYVQDIVEEIKVKEGHL